jgi:hypothetical protein
MRSVAPHLHPNTTARRRESSPVRPPQMQELLRCRPRGLRHRWGLSQTPLLQWKRLAAYRGQAESEGGACYAIVSESISQSVNQSISVRPKGLDTQIHIRKPKQVEPVKALAVASCYNNKYKVRTSGICIIRRRDRVSTV